MKEQIFKMYKEISIGKNEICNECKKHDSKLNSPVSIYHVGEEFDKSNDTILFVGKTAVGGDGEFSGLPFDEDKLFIDATKFGEKSLDGNEHKSPFYSYTKEIIEKYYGSYENGKKYIAFSNMVKCNNGTTEDTTEYQVQEHCVNKLRVIWKEVEILYPKRIIFYTHTTYDYFIEKYFKESNLENIIDFKTSPIGPQWHGRCTDKNNNIICEFLRLGHPQGKIKDEFVNVVVRWLQSTKK